MPSRFACHRLSNLFCSRQRAYYFIILLPMRLSPVSTPVSVAGGNAATTDRLAACPWLGTSPSGRCLSLDWKQLFSYQSFIPAAAGTPRYENWVHWLMEGFRCRLCPPPHPWLGTSPSPTFLFRPWAVVVRATVVGVAGRRRNSSRIGVRDMRSYQ